MKRLDPAPAKEKPEFGVAFPKANGAFCFSPDPTDAKLGMSFPSEFPPKMLGFDSEAVGVFVLLPKIDLEKLKSLPAGLPPKMLGLESVVVVGVLEALPKIDFDGPEPKMEGEALAAGDAVNEKVEEVGFAAKAAIP